MIRTRRSLYAVTFLMVFLTMMAACTQGQPDQASDETTPPSPPAATQPPTQAPSLITGDTEEELAEAGIRTSAWSTDFSTRSTPLTEFRSGGPPKDGIPAIDEPRFITIQEADEWLAGPEPVQVVEVNDDVRAYPLQILMWHEIVNDEIGGKPVAVTYCPLCNTALAFDATLPDGRVLDFGVTGMLRFSDLVMYDRQTESWWQQAMGEALVGELTGTRLTFLSSPVVSWEEFKRAHPEGRVLSRETGFLRDYGRNLYTRYDSGQPFLFRGEEDDRLPATERVVAVEIGADAAAFPFSVLEEQPVVHTSVGGRDIVIFYKKGTASALDSSRIADGKDVGAAGVFVPAVDSRSLTFQAEGEYFRDDQTATLWDLLGNAVEGQLAGERLEPVVHGNHFWFAWAAFQPDTRLYQGE
ncbi:MAG: DUF3179 domain-containing protein [Dehalococcoidia bacterium]